MEFTTPASSICTGAWAAGFATVAASCDTGCFAAPADIIPDGGDGYTLVAEPASGEVTLPPGYPMHLLFPARAPRAGGVARAYASYAPPGMGELSGTGAVKKRGRVECAGGRDDKGGDDDEIPPAVDPAFLDALRAQTPPESGRPAVEVGKPLPAAGRPFQRPDTAAPPPRSANVEHRRPPVAAGRPPPSSIRSPEVDREALERDFNRGFAEEVLRGKTPPPPPRLTPPPLPAREKSFPIPRPAAPPVEDARSQLPTVETPAVSPPDGEFSGFDDLRGEPTQVTRIALPADGEKPTVDGAVLEFAQWRDANYAVATKARREADIRSTEAIFSAAIAFLKHMPAPEVAKIADWRPALIIEVSNEKEMHRLARLAAARTLLARTRDGDSQAAKAAKEARIAASRMFAALSDIERELVEVGRSALMRAMKPAILDWLKREKSRTAEMLVLVLAAGNWPGIAFLSRLVREEGSKLAQEILEEAIESEESAARNVLESFAKRPASARQFPTLQSFDIGAVGAFSLSFWDVPQTAWRRNLPAILHLQKKYPELRGDLVRMTGEIKQWEAALGTRWHLSFSGGKEISAESVAAFRKGLEWFANKKGIGDLDPATCDFRNERTFARACEILAAMLDEWQSLYKKWEETLYAAYLIITGRDGDASFIPLIHADEPHIALAIDKIGEK